MTGAKSWTNPLRDARDKRLPRIAGPCGLVIFGVTGDLSRKKLMPAIYDLANRGLLPPGFALTASPAATGRRRTSGRSSTRPSGPTPAPRSTRTVWDRLAEGFRFVQGSFDDDDSFDRLELTVARPRPGPRHGRQPCVLPVDPARRLPRGVQAAGPLRPLGPGRAPVAPRGDREAVRARPEVGDRGRRHRQRRLPRGLGVPHRPLPRQGDGAEHPGAALRHQVFEPI